MASLSLEIGLSDTEEKGWDNLLNHLIKHSIITKQQAEDFINPYVGTEIELDAEYVGTVVPYYSGDLENPPEGGYCEDDAVIVYSENKLNLSRALKYERIMKELSTLIGTVYTSSEEISKAKKLRTKLKYKIQSLRELDITEFIPQRDLENWSQKAYEESQY